GNENNEQDEEHISVDTLWLNTLKQKVDRLFFRYEGDRRVLEMRTYRRSEGKVGQHWLMGLTARIRNEVKIDVQRDERGHATSSILHDLESGKVLKLDAGGTFVVERLDGTHTFYDIYMDFIDKISLTRPEHLAMIFTALESAGMLERHDREAKKLGILGRLSDIVNKLTFRSLNIPHTDRVVDDLYERVKWLFNPFVTALILLFALSGFIPLFNEISALHELISKPALVLHANPFLIFELYILMTLVAIMHEFSHALTCRHFGGSVHRIGIMFYLAMIIFFADVSAAWGFRNKWKRIAVALAGPILNLVIMSVSFWMWYFQKAYVQPEHSIWFLMGFFCLYSTVLNFVPFIKMDGYYMLSDLTGISTLREKSFAYLGQKLYGVFGMELNGEKIRPTRKEKWVFWSYGVAGVAFTALFFAFPFVEFIHYISAEHPSRGMLIFFGVIVALTLYNAAYRSYQMVHSRLYREIVIE
ncbi:MAG: hypothetical protein MI702_12265, partial [Chlorobiales bacterium]|nr:hypothetical protein [Chlorobiales bacterium]